MTRFKYFVVLAGMRTGSNLLEEQLSAMSGVTSYGELFNPHFFGKPKIERQFGLSMKARENNPLKVIEAMCAADEGVPGFRLFYDHDPRVIEHVLQDTSAAKIVLSRRPIDSFVSLQIARKTNQWWLGDVTTRKSAKVKFDAQEYAAFLEELRGFQSKITHHLQISGQTAFSISYDDLSDDAVLAGLGQYLGAAGAPDQTKIRAKVQNPRPVLERLSNPEAAQAMLAEIVQPDLEHQTVYEPGRGPGLRGFKACENLGLLYMPIRGAWVDPVPGWMRAIDPENKVMSGLSQKDLRHWKREHPYNRSFTILRHPLARAHDAFCRYILPTNEENYRDIRAVLTQRFDVPLPESWPANDWSKEKHQKAFLAFLQFLERNLSGQTSVRVDNTWASQATLLAAIAQFVVPDRLVRETDMKEELPQLAMQVGVEASEAIEFASDAPFSIDDIANDEINKACAKAYRRDYVMYGFSETL